MSPFGPPAAGPPEETAAGAGAAALSTAAGACTPVCPEWPLRPRARRPWRRHCRLRVGVQPRDHLVGDDGSAVALDDVDEHAVGRRRQLEYHLVGLDVDQVLVARDRFTDLLVPLQQRGLGDRLGQLRNLDLDDGHL